MKRLPGLIILTFALAQMAPAANWFVATNGTGGGTSWADATNSLQGAIVASSAGDTVWVSNGVYDVGGITNFPTGTVLTNRIAIYKAIIVQAFSTNPVDTVIKGAGPNGPAAVRCVWMTNGSTLIGFTLTNGATLTSGANVERGGGVSCQSTNTTISNCVLTGNSAGIYGGGAIYGTLYNCTLTGNSSIYGGGTYVSTLFNCTLTSNSATNSGGGAYYGILNDCTLTGNSASNSYNYAGGGGTYYGTLSNCTLTGNSAVNGGGTFAGTLFNCTLISNTAVIGGGGADGGPTVAGALSNCTLTGNSATANNGGSGGGAKNIKLYNCTLSYNSAGPGVGSSSGGGALGGALYNCTIVSNLAPGGNAGGVVGGTLYNCTIVGNRGQYYGGGVNGCSLYNCTIVGNSAGSTGGGVQGGTLYNCISWGNDKVDAGPTYYFSCGAGYTNGGSVSGNITNDPLFVTNGSGFGTNHVAGNYRLRNVSPPLNMGTNMLWMTNSWGRIDLDGSRRIDQFSRQVDMGCYELMPRGTMFMIGQ